MSRISLCWVVASVAMSIASARSVARPEAGRTLQDDPVATARKATEEARRTLGQARRRLEEDYRELEEEFAAIASEGGRRFSNLVHEQVAGLFSQIQEIYRKMAGEDTSASRRALARHIEPALAGLLRDRIHSHPLTVPAFETLLIDALAKTLFERLYRGDGEPAQAVALALEASIDPTRPFHELWNRVLYKQRPSAQAYADAYNAYITAGVELDRAQHPERYLPGGQRVPPGMVYIPGGSYSVGPNSGFERERRRVSLRSFVIDRFEVTCEAYRLFLQSLPPEQRTAHLPLDWTLDDDDQARFPEGRATHPVSGVTWLDADAYASWAGKRLPTEEEWEVAASGKRAWLYPWGNEYRPGRCNSRETKHEGTVPVGSYTESASPFGCEEMAGNVAEWTASTDRGERIEKLSSPLTSVVIRGGSYRRGAENVTTRFRWIAPGLRTRDKTIGFRCAADLR